MEKLYFEKKTNISFSGAWNVMSLLPMKISPAVGITKPQSF